MTDLGWTLVVALVVWHVVMTIVLLVVLRQVAVLSVVTGLSKRTQREATLVIGGTVPGTLTEAVPELFEPGTVHYVVWLTGQCLACTSLADELVSPQGADFVEPIVLILTGSDTGARRIAERLSGRVARVVLDPAATTVVNELGLDAYPFAIEVERGLITGWTGVASLHDLKVLRGARAHSNASSVVTAVEGRATAVPNQLTATGRDSEA